MASANVRNLGLVPTVTCGWVFAMTLVWVVAGQKAYTAICVSKNLTETRGENVYAVQSGAINNAMNTSVFVLLPATGAMAHLPLIANLALSMLKEVQLAYASVVLAGAPPIVRYTLETAMSYVAMDVMVQLNMTVLTV